MTIPIETLRELFTYDAETGVLAWRISRSNTIRVGQVVANPSATTGYLRVSVNKKMLAAHRVAWALHYGQWPEGVIDHINHNRADNRIANLRDVPRLLNNLHRSGPQKNKGDLPLGVYLHKGRGKYYSQIQHNGHNRWLGYFPTAEAASEAHTAAKQQIMEAV